MRIEVFCDDPNKIVEYLSTFMPAMGERPYHMKVQRINRGNRPYQFNGYIEHTIRGREE
jgi:hypothetical protein